MENADLRSNPSLRANRNPAQYDEGLRSHMLRIYNYMVLALAVTGVVAYLTEASGFTATMVEDSYLFFAIAFSPLLIVLAMSLGGRRSSVSTLHFLFWTYATLNGVSPSVLISIYTASSIFQALLITSAAFGSLSLYGYTTKRDLSAMETFLMIGLVGIIIALVANLFIFQSTMFDLAIAAVTVIVFAGLTAWDTQKLKEMYSANDTADTQARQAIFGALELYLDFLNLMLAFLRLFGIKKD